MYLGTMITDFAGVDHAMAGVLPVASRIDKPRLSLGYRTVRALADGPLLKMGEIARGHEFHWSNIGAAETSENAYSVMEQEGRVEGFQKGSVLASYIHLHLAALPSMARRFVETCASFAGVS
jgi:cobyrinic acid a,c-diamide synthase